MKKLHLFFMCISFSTCFACQDQEIKRNIRLWLNKEIILPAELHYTPSIDSIWNNLLSHEYKIMTVVDSNTCTDCHLNLYEWKKLIREIDSITNNTAFLFIIHSKDYALVNIIKEKNKFNYPIIYDYDNKIGKLNNFSHDPRFQTFLLDQNNRVILLGNPTKNSYIWDLYKKVITKERLINK